MSYRVYSGPAGTELTSPLDKQSLLFKEFSTLDQALSWARHMNQTGRVALCVDGDDGTNLNKRDIVNALHHSENLSGASG
jgi:hypothetical protein